MVLFPMPYRKYMFTCQFLQRDPHPGNLSNPTSFANGYIYVQNRPTMLVDPTGRNPWVVIAIVAFLSTAYQNWNEGGNFLEQFAVNFVISTLFYGAGVLLGGPEFPPSATFSQNMTAVANSVGGKSILTAVAWEAEHRGIASRDMVMLIAFAAGTYGKYNSNATVKSGPGDWVALGQSAGQVLVFSSEVPSILKWFGIGDGDGDASAQP